MKGNLLLGTARGKMGDIVGKVVHGKQVFAKYQPVVFNPKSSKQQTVRNRFAIANFALKDLRAKLKENDLNILYQQYSGASKNLRNLIIPYVMDLQKIESIGAYSMFPKMQNPLDIISVTGNSIQGEIEPTMGLYLIGDPLNPGTQYFGSDVELNVNTSLVGITSYHSENFPYYVNNQIKSLIITLVPHTNAGPKGYGLKSSLEDVGNWNYVYSVSDIGTEDTGIEFGIGNSSLPYNGTKNQYSGYLIWVDGDSRPIATIAFNGLQDLPTP